MDTQSANEWRVALKDSRDPDDWLILGDFYEERGDMAMANFYRRLGAWGKVLFQTWLDVACSPSGRARNFSLEGIPFRVYRTDQSVWTRAWWKIPAYPVALVDTRCYPLSRSLVWKLLKAGQKMPPVVPNVPLDYNHPGESEFAHLRDQLTLICWAPGGVPWPESNPF
jgi:hypothetical protein